ncbi:aldose 1-epimerase [Crenobacter intestini]|uniref:Aldose 1-epimerase n=1 Tax=Crenobacter intestini TaxID=2563443 RepID=A0A4V4N879_9NEIS|nr:aldose 1-epimerase [Crenobacter intestini]TIC83403.1 aldose 1-epimerase [Crenobacter intestini]
MTSELIHLKHGELEASLCPSLGGALAGFSCAGTALLRPWNGEATVRKMASYPLVPYSNRIADGRFGHAGRDVALRRNFGDHPHPLHGLGWQRAWTVADHSAHEATLLLQHRVDDAAAAADWPWAFDARQHFALEAEGLTVTLSYHNLSDESVPVGLGWHPYFPRHEDAELSFSAAEVWLMDERALPSERVEVPAAWDYRAARPVGAPGLDNCFARWQREARIAWPGKGLAVRLQASPALEHLVVFTPQDADFIAVEPVSHANNAINMQAPGAHGIKHVAPGASYEVLMHLSIERITR